MYEYLYSATSRAVHFSVGEVFRRSWGAPRGIVVTDKMEFRRHLGEFALDSLWRLLFKTVEAALPFLDDAGIVSSDALTDEPIIPLLRKVLACGRVPFVHAHEWNLTPDGPLYFPL